MATGLKGVLLLALAGLLATGCDSTVAPEEEERTFEGHVNVFFLKQADRLVRPDTLARYDVRTGQVLPRGRMWSRHVSLDFKPNGFNVVGEEETGKGAVIFLGIKEDGAARDDVFLESFGVNEGQVFVGSFGVGDKNSPASKAGSALEVGKQANSFQGTLYMFFIDGIGDPQNGPVEVQFLGSDGNRATFTIDPRTYTLLNEPALHVTGPSLGLQGTQEGFIVEMRKEQGEPEVFPLNVMRAELPVTQSGQTAPAWLGSTHSNVSYSLGMSQSDLFEYNLFFVEL